MADLAVEDGMVPGSESGSLQVVVGNNHQPNELNIVCIRCLGVVRQVLPLVLSLFGSSTSALLACVI